MSYQYDNSGNITGLTYNYTSLTISGITIYTISGLVYPKITLSGLIYTPITISSYISLSGLFTGYNTSYYYSLSGLINSNYIFNYLTSSSYISPFKSSYTISSYIFNIPNNQWLVNSDYNQLYSSYLAGVLDISGTLILRSGNFICDNIIDSYSRLLNVSLSNIVYSNYLIQGNLINNSSSIDSYSRLLNISISNNVNNHDFRIGALEYKTTGLSYSAFNSYFSTILNAGSCIFQDTTINGMLQNNNNFTSTGYINFTNTTDSTSLNIAGVVAYGGLSVKKQLRVGNNVTIDGTTNLNNPIIIRSAQSYALLVTNSQNNQLAMINSDGSTLLNGILNMGANTYLNNNTLYLRNDNYHYIKYGFRDGPCIAGNAGLSLGISNPSYSEIIGFSPTSIDLQKPTYLNNNALYLKSDTNHYLKYDATRDGPQIAGNGCSLGVLNTGVYSEVIGFNSTSIGLQKSVTVNGDINCNGNLNHPYLYISSSGTYNISMSSAYKYVFINSSNVYINLAAGNAVTNIIYFINLNGSNNINYTLYGGISNTWLYSSVWAIFTPTNSWKSFTFS